jgi:hypothetical protein
LNALSRHNGRSSGRSGGRSGLLAQHVGSGTGSSSLSFEVGRSLLRGHVAAVGLGKSAKTARDRTGDHLALTLALGFASAGLDAGNRLLGTLLLGRLHLGELASDLRLSADALLLADELTRGSLTSGTHGGSLSSLLTNAGALVFEGGLSSRAATGGDIADARKRSFLCGTALVEAEHIADVFGGDRSGDGADETESSARKRGSGRDAQLRHLGGLRSLGLFGSVLKQEFVEICGHFSAPRQASCAY